MLQHFDAAEYLVWIDADAIITNLDFDVSGIFNDKDIYMSKDINGWNAGVFAVKTSDIGRSFLERVMDLYPQYRNAGFREQSCMAHLMDCVQPYKDSVCCIPARTWNSYDPIYGKTPRDNIFQSGDFILHLPAASKDYRVRRFTEIISKLYTTESIRGAILFVTRLSRPNTDIARIYPSISDNFTDYHWLVYVDHTKTMTPTALNDIVKTDNNVIVNHDLAKNTKFFVEAIYSAFTSDYAKRSKWLYVLDDDNIVHPDLKKVIEEAPAADLIISDLDDRRPNTSIARPRNLSANHCVGSVDFASCLFSTAYPVLDFDIMRTADISCDGALVKFYLENKAAIYYSNRIAGYYNKLRS